MSTKLHAAYIATILVIGGVSLSVLAERVATIAKLKNEAIELENSHKKDRSELREKVKEAINEAWVGGWKEAEKQDYKNGVALCQNWYKAEKAVERCINEQNAGAPKDVLAKLEATGYKGHLLMEDTYKTKEAALNDLNKNGWSVDEAEEIGDTLVWDSNYPRIMKLVPTKTGWAWVGTFADIEPVVAKKGEQKEG